ncbi:hypothetical protein MATL_G00233580 [Megalops atlanticus]|uniref:Uncharacterized protein n=1 Tax=Megalops atlanticus TaxID=7932 RepID=A0A9D3PHR6_MEGAT|nr:hypothetical protein MATL_G00233580 [Megalops atlanticus]
MALDLLESPGDNVDRATTHRPPDLIGSSFQQSSNRNSPNHHEDDVDLEALVNDMNASFDSLYSTCSLPAESAPLLQNGQLHRRHAHQRPGPAQPPPTSPKQKVRRSQPMHILAVRRLQEEEQQLRTSSLPAIPNPFPELCSPAGSPILGPGSLPPCEPSGTYSSSVLSAESLAAGRRPGVSPEDAD